MRTNLIKEGTYFTQGANVKISVPKWSFMVEVFTIWCQKRWSQNWSRIDRNTHTHIVFLRYKMTLNVMVNEKFSVKFNYIISYQDEVLCDIIPMNICHMLLGRPWQFDRHAIHDGWANTYTLTKDGVKHKLEPLKEKEENVCSSAIIYFIDGKEFLQGMKHEHMCFSIIHKDGKEEVEEVPTEVTDMLGEFPILC